MKLPVKPLLSADGAGPLGTGAVDVDALVLRFAGRHAIIASALVTMDAGVPVATFTDRCTLHHGAVGQWNLTPSTTITANARAVVVTFDHIFGWHDGTVGNLLGIRFEDAVGVAAEPALGFLVYVLDTVCGP